MQVIHRFSHSDSSYLTIDSSTLYSTDRLRESEEGARMVSVETSPVLLISTANRGSTTSIVSADPRRIRRYCSDPGPCSGQPGMMVGVSTSPDYGNRRDPGGQDRETVNRE